jgi:hypothetical protein
MADKTSLESALDAINEALGVTESGDEELEHGDDEVSADDTESATDDGDSEDESTGDETTEDDADADSEDEEGEQTDEEKAAAAKAAKSEFNADGTRKEPGKKKPDPINDPIPKDLKKETSERMRSLITMAKEKDTALAKVQGDFDTFVNGIRASGSSPEQYGEAISWLSLFNSPKVEDRTKAYELVNDVADRMATMLGIDRASADPLAGHADLIAAVKANPATMAMAKEIARNRNASKLTGDINANVRQQQQTQEQAQAEHEQAKVDLNAFDAEMRLKDPLYDAKRKLIVPILQPLFKTIPKSQWAAAYKEAYAQARVQPKGKLNGGGAAKGQPLRGNKNPAGGRAREPANALEAMNAGLAMVK